jgi:hypothetical protein
MNTTLQLDSYQYKCRSCFKRHSGPTKVLDFQCAKDAWLAHGRERIYTAALAFHCECDQHIQLTIQVREYPEGIFEYLGCQSADADLEVVPKIREHMEFVDD